MTEKVRTTANHSGMGAIPHAKGVTFRVWAPHAEKVYLIGSFNDWSETSTPLVSEKNGYSATDVKTRAEGADGLPCSGEIGIGPYTVVIFSQDE